MGAGGPAGPDHRARVRRSLTQAPKIHNNPANTPAQSAILRTYDRPPLHHPRHTRAPPPSYPRPHFRHTRAPTSVIPALAAGISPSPAPNAARTSPVIPVATSVTPAPPDPSYPRLPRSLPLARTGVSRRHQHPSPAALVPAAPLPHRPRPLPPSHPPHFPSYPPPLSPSFPPPSGNLPRAASYAHTQAPSPPT